MPARPLPIPVIYAGTGPGGASLVRAYEAETHALAFERQVYESSFTGGVRLATADFTRDGYPDLVVAPGPGGGPRVKILDGRTGEVIPGPLGDFFAYEPEFTGGVVAAAADVDGDRWPDLVTAAGAGGGPRVRAFSGKTGTVIADFFAYAPDFLGGVTVAAADFTGDRKSELVIGAGQGGGPRVRVIDVATQQSIAGPLGDFFAFETSFTGGVNVGTDWKTGDVDGDKVPDLVVGAGPGRAAEVRIYSGKTGVLINNYNVDSSTGVRVATSFVTDDPFADVVTAVTVDGVDRVRVYDGSSATLIAGPSADFVPFSFASAGGINIASSNDPPIVSVGEVTQVGFEGYQSAILTLIRAENTDGALMVNIGYSGDVDWESRLDSPPDTATFQDGYDTVEVTVPILSNDDYEGDLQFLLHIEEGEGYDLSETEPLELEFTVYDDEQPPTSAVFFDTESNVEGDEHSGTPAGFTLLRSEPIDEALTVWLTYDGLESADVDRDFIGPASVEIPPGEASVFVSIPVVDDNDEEDDEDFAVSIGEHETYRIIGDPLQLTITDQSSSDPVSMASAEGEYVGDFVWRDDNLNGRQDYGEPGVQGVFIKLWAQNSIAWPDGPVVVGTAYSDEDGKFKFAVSEMNNYQLEFIVDDDLYAFTERMAPGTTIADDSNVFPERGKTEWFIVTPDTFDSSRDCGLVAYGSVAGTVWFDADEDGTQDGEPNEPGLAGIAVSLFESDDDYVASQMTDEDGDYLFTKLWPGSYYVLFAYPYSADVGFSSPDQGTDDEIDSDVIDDGMTDTIGVDSAEEVQNIAAGVVTMPIGTDIVIGGNTENTEGGWILASPIPTEKFTDVTEDSIGGLVIKRADGNNAPRQKIVLHKVMDPAYLPAQGKEWQGQVRLTYDNKVELYDAENGGNVVDTGTDFYNSTLPKAFWVQGKTESSSMRDVTIKANALSGGNPVEEGADSVKFTVAWVEVSVKLVDSVTPENDKKDAYKALLDNHTYLLGPGHFTIDNVKKYGWGFEAKGVVYPSDYEYSLAAILDRDCDGYAYENDNPNPFANKPYSPTVIPSNDVSPAMYRDINPPEIYDLDVPAMAKPASALNAIRRMRFNFKEFANIGGVRASVIKTGFVVYSIIQNDSPFGINWSLLPATHSNAVAGDNNYGLEAQSKTTWNLQ